MPRLYFNRAFYTRARRDVVFGFVVNPDRAGGDPSVRAACLALGCSRERSDGTRARRGKQHARRNLARGSPRGVRSLEKFIGASRLGSVSDG